MSESASYAFDEIRKNPGDQYEVELALYRLCASVWRGNESVDSGEFIRPTKPNGFAYQCTQAGLTASFEPRWPAQIDEKISDGAAEWKCVAAGANGIFPISGAAAAVDPPGLTVTGAGVSENTKLVGTYEQGTLGQTYLVQWSFTMNGKTRYAHQSVKVCKV